MLENTVLCFFTLAGAVQILAGEVLGAVREVAVQATVAVVGQVKLTEFFLDVLLHCLCREFTLLRRKEFFLGLRLRLYFLAFGPFWLAWLLVVNCRVRDWGLTFAALEYFVERVVAVLVVAGDTRWVLNTPELTSLLPLGCVGRKQHGTPGSGRRSASRTIDNTYSFGFDRNTRGCLRHRPRVATAVRGQLPFLPVTRLRSQAGHFPALLGLDGGLGVPGGGRLPRRLRGAALRQVGEKQFLVLPATAGPAGPVRTRDWAI